MVPAWTYWCQCGLFWLVMLLWWFDIRAVKRLKRQRDNLISLNDDIRENWRNEIANSHVQIIARDESLAAMKAAVKGLEAERIKLRASVQDYRSRPRVNGYEFTTMLKNASGHLGECLRMIEVAKGEKSYPHIKSVEDDVATYG